MASFPQRYAIYFADLNPTVEGEIRMGVRWSWSVRMR